MFQTFKVLHSGPVYSRQQTSSKAWNSIFQRRLFSERASERKSKAKPSRCWGRRRQGGRGANSASKSGTFARLCIFTSSFSYSFIVPHITDFFFGLLFQAEFLSLKCLLLKFLSRAAFEKTGENQHHCRRNSWTPRRIGAAGKSKKHNIQIHLQSKRYLV